MNDICKRLNNLSMEELIKVMAALDEHNTDYSLRTVTVNNNGIVRTKNDVEGGDDRVVQEL